MPDPRDRYRKLLATIGDPAAAPQERETAFGALQRLYRNHPDVEFREAQGATPGPEQPRPVAGWESIVTQLVDIGADVAKEAIRRKRGRR